VATAVAARLHLVLLAVAVRLLLAAVAAVAFLCRNIGALWQRLGKRLCTLLFAIELLLKYELDLQKEESFRRTFLQMVAAVLKSRAGATRFRSLLGGQSRCSPSFIFFAPFHNPIGQLRSKQQTALALLNF
jgi:hypothetical protein